MTMQLPRSLTLNLNHLSLHPPQVLLIEGGNEESRLNAALYWVQNLNCPETLARAQSSLPAVPCGSCSICRLITNLEYNDIAVYDGRISNRQDEENPGLIRALHMENMRKLKSLAAEAPRGNGVRAVIFQGLTQTREEAMNSLLKTLEEPSPFTVFILLAPQRAQLLPTLVSRSFCITLPWQSASAPAAQPVDWLNALAEFFKNGSAFLEKTSAKNALDTSTASAILSSLQIAITKSISKMPSDHEIEKLLAPLACRPSAVFDLSNWINEAQQMLDANVNPSRVLEAFAARSYCLLKETG